MSMVKALTQIVIVDVGPDVVSMSIVEKENQSGFKFNQRLFIVVHGVFFGYISKVKMNEDPNNVAIADAKVKVPIQNLYSMELEDTILKIKFRMTEEGKLVPKEWIFKLASEKLAELWKQYLEYEIKMRDKIKIPKNRLVSPDKRTTSKDDTSRSKIKAVSVQKLGLNQPAVEQKKQEQKNIDQNSKVLEISKPKKTAPVKVFENPLFQDGGSQSEEESSRKKSKRKLSKTKQQIQKPEKSKRETGANMIEIKNQMLESKVLHQPPNPPSPKYKKPVPQQKPQMLKKQSIKNIKPLEITVEEPIESSSKVESIPQQKREVKEPMSQNKSKIQKSNLKEVNLSKIQEEANNEETPKYEAEKLVVSNKMNSKRKSMVRSSLNAENLKQPTAIQKQIQFMDQIINKVNDKHQKNPIYQIPYDPKEAEKLMKLYGDKLGEMSNNSRTQHLLNHILQAQKLKITLNKQSKIKEQQLPWTYLQFKEEESTVLLKFQDHCKKLMKNLYCELFNKQLVKFTKTKSEKNIVHYLNNDIQIKMPIITLNQSDRSPVKILDKSALKIVKKQFKYIKYLYTLIANKGSIRVPLSCLCQFNGIVALFKAKCSYYQHQTNNPQLSRDIARLEQLSHLPIEKILKNSLKPLNQFYYNQLMPDNQQISYNYQMVQQITALFPLDLLATDPTQYNQLRMQLVQQQTTSILPLIAARDIDYSDGQNNTNQIQTLSNKLTSKIDRIAAKMNNAQLYFIHPNQLSNLMHSHGINIRYMGQLYIKVIDQFNKYLLLSDMAARIVKTLLSKTLQDYCYQHGGSQIREEDIQNVVNDQIIDFMNCLFGNSQESKIIWQLITKNVQSYFKVSIDSVQTLNKGQLLISIAYHCNISLNWRKIQTSHMFQTNQFITKDMLNSTDIRSSNYEPQSYKLKQQLKQKLTKLNQQNMKWMVDNLQLKQQKLPQQLRLIGISAQIKLYLSNFIQPEQLDWANNYSHLSLFQTAPPSLINFRIDLNAIKYYLKTNNKFKYLNKFNQFTHRVQSLYGSNHPILSDMYQIFAANSQMKGEIQDAGTFIKSAILNLSAISGDNNSQVAAKYFKLSQLLIKNNRQVQAIGHLKKIKQILQITNQKQQVLYAQARLNLAMIYFKQNKYAEVLQQLQQVIDCFDMFEKNSLNSYETQRLQSYQLTFISNNKLNKQVQSLQISNRLQHKLDYFKIHSNFQQILWMIVECNFKFLSNDCKQSIVSIWNGIPIKLFINSYKKSYQLIKNRNKQTTFFDHFKRYFQNSPKILQLILQKGLLQDWQNLKTVYQRQTLFDYISLMQQLIYLLGRDRLISLHKASN